MAVKTVNSVRRVLCGGSWSFHPDYLRSSFRNGYGPDNRNYNIGFRVIISKEGRKD